MRLSILDKGHSFGTKALFAFIRLVTRDTRNDQIDRLPPRLLRGTHEEGNSRSHARLLGVVGCGP